jgi:ubiquinone biosynthesis protein
MMKTAMVLSRFGPKLPQMIEGMLNAQAPQPPKQKSHNLRQKTVYAGLGGMVALIGAYALGLF